jgi:hypothetical protein
MDLEERPPESDTIMVERIPSLEPHPEELISGIREVQTSWLRPTSGW